jgi:hypothetical protein
VALETVGGYNAARVDGWLGTRVRPAPAGGWWSDINPVSRDLAKREVLASDAARNAFAHLGALDARGELDFPVHFLVAGRGSAGTRGKEEMPRLLPSTCVHPFPDSHHSIHNWDDGQAYCALLHKIVLDAARF